MLHARRRKLPPLDTLRFFEATARLGSFARAADELCVTSGAVSRQVKSLEASLGVRLFHRRPQHLEITQAGRAFFATVRDALSAIEREARRFETVQDRVHLSVSPNFGMQWLSSRLHEFRAAHPTISLIVNASPDLADLSAGDIDLAVRFCSGPWMGVEAEQLFGGELVPVVSQRLLSRQRVAEPAQIAGLPLIHVETTDAWAQWFEAVGVKPKSTCGDTIVSHACIAVAAAASGAGAALVHPALVSREVCLGELQVVSGHKFASDKSYWLAHSSGRKPKKATKVVMNWMRKRSQLGC